MRSRFERKAIIGIAACSLCAMLLVLQTPNERDTKPAVSEFPAPQPSVGDENFAGLIDHDNFSSLAELGIEEYPNELSIVVNGTVLRPVKTVVIKRNRKQNSWITRPRPAGK